MELPTLPYEYHVITGCQESSSHHRWCTANYEDNVFQEEDNVYDTGWVVLDDVGGLSSENGLSSAGLTGGLTGGGLYLLCVSGTTLCKWHESRMRWRWHK
ncbi:hypothetical protein RIF29_39409 [Crotalaria pallida]|uniref:Uncharacterized protein n=1 Tax=Crotalaria pallida TaxID=3830 RepID=A0AAN9E6J2_CROPI